MRAPKVGIRAFRSGLAEFIAAATPLAITRHGHMAAYFVPASAESEPGMAALKWASGSLDVGAEKGKRAGRRKAEPTKRVARIKHERNNA